MNVSTKHPGAFMKFLSVLLLVFSFSAQATQYCYDDGVFAIEDLKEALSKCEGVVGMNIERPLLQTMESRLVTNNPLFYKRRAFKTLSKIDHHIGTLPQTECHTKLRAQYNSNWRQDIQGAIEMCGI
jgi:hypothetical protein